MAKYTVTASELISAANQLSEDNNQFRARVNDLSNCNQELAAMWQGEANTTFQQYFGTNSENWRTFASLIDQYVAALNNIANIYQQAEQTNVEIARTT